MYPFWSALIAAVIAQVLKPLIRAAIHREWKPNMVLESGGMPSSHSAMVTALALSVGIQENFRSTLFAVSTILAIIVVYDAANVRYYSGQNAQVTQQLVKDVQDLFHVDFQDPVYDIKLKEVLGHKWSEVLGGIILGIAVALIINFCF